MPAKPKRSSTALHFIERTFGETRRRVKVIGRLPGEHTCLSLVWAVLDRASAGWRGFTMTANGLRLLHDLRRSQLDPPTELPRRDTDTPAPPDSVDAVAQRPRRAEPTSGDLHRTWDATGPPRAERDGVAIGPGMPDQVEGRLDLLRCSPPHQARALIARPS